MLRSLIGFVLGALVAGAVAFAWLHAGAKDCLERCGDGTTCTAGRCVAALAPATAASTAASDFRKKIGHRTGVAQSAKGLVMLRPGDDQMVPQGDALGRPEHIDMTRPGDDGKLLDQDDIDKTFGGVQSGISQCITTAIGDFPLTAGTVDVGFRIERSGEVSRVRMEAPQLLQRQGLMDCVRPLVKKLSFPKSGGASVVNYPFEIK